MVCPLWQPGITHGPEWYLTLYFHRLKLIKGKKNPKKQPKAACNKHDSWCEWTSFKEKSERILTVLLRRIWFFLFYLNWPALLLPLLLQTNLSRRREREIFNLVQKVEFSGCARKMFVYTQVIIYCLSGWQHLW